MRVGLHALGIGPGADPAVIGSVARAADAAGFATLWAGEHVVMVDRPDTPYPYAEDGRIAVPSDAAWLDPMVLLGYVAALTSRIRIATGILLLPQHHPLVVAKQAASLDILTGGRLALGVGIGWSREEFGSLGVPFGGRARRTREYVEVMRTIWRDDPASYDGEFVRFEAVRSHPKPVRPGGVPVILGGNSDAALERVAAYGDGWYGFNLERAELGPRIEELRSQCRRAGRDPAGLDIAVSLQEATPADAADVAELGVSELVVVGSPPPEPGDAGEWVRSLAGEWGVVPRGGPHPRP